MNNPAEMSKEEHESYEPDSIEGIEKYVSYELSKLTKKEFAIQVVNVHDKHGITTDMYRVTTRYSTGQYCSMVVMRVLLYDTMINPFRLIAKCLVENLEGKKRRLLSTLENGVMEIIGRWSNSTKNGHDGIWKGYSSLVDEMNEAGFDIHRENDIKPTVKLLNRDGFLSYESTYNGDGQLNGKGYFVRGVQ